MTDLSFILQEVSEHTGISIEQIKGKSRETDIKRARFAYCYIARRATRESLKKIGEQIGGRDHATVINAIEKVENYLDQPWEMRRWLWCKEVAETFRVINERTNPTTALGSEIIKAHDYYLAKDYESCVKSLKMVLDALKDSVWESLAADQKMFEEVNG